MSVTAQDYLNLVDNDANNISSIFKGLVHNSWVISAHCAAAYLDSKIMLKDITLEISLSDQLVDEKFNLIARLDKIRSTVKELHHKMNGSLFMCRYFLKKTIDNCELLVKVIIEHDAKVLGIPDTELPIDELMAELNSPENKEMLGRSIAQLRRGNFSTHKLNYE